jgi:RNA polymerase subunit RPABC4/transcription elongation factor Spt4
MAVKSESQSVLASEIKIVPRWVWVLAGIVFIAAQLLPYVVRHHHHEPPPPAWALPLIGFFAGIAASAYLLLIGYINRDAKRRGMSPTLWTIVAILIPNALGILLYFVLRHPLRSACPQCGYAVEMSFSFCPRCSYKLGTNCPRCQRLVGMNDVFCPYCGTSLRNPATPVVGPATDVPG